MEGDGGLDRENVDDAQAGLRAGEPGPALGASGSEISARGAEGEAPLLLFPVFVLQRERCLRVGVDLDL